MAGITKDGGAPLTAHDIYVQITSGPGTKKLQEAHEAAQKETSAEQTRAEHIEKLTGMISDGWEGSASERAYDATKPLGDTAALRSVQLGFTHQYLQSQIAAFDTAKNGVKPVDASPPSTAVVSEAVPWFGDIDGEMSTYQNDSQNNIAVFSAYDNASKSNGEALPTEYPAFKDGSDSPGFVLNDHESDDSSSESGADARTSHSHTGSGVPSVPGGSTVTHSSGQSAPPPTGQSVAQVPPGSTSASSAMPPPIYQPGSGGYPQTPAAQGPTTGAFNLFGPYGGPGSSYGGGSVYGRGYGGGAGSGYGGDSGSGYGSGSGSGSGARTGGSPEGPRSGAGAGAIPAEESIARRLNPGATRGGMSGMSGIGAGHGADKDEDTEHERPSFLQEDDPEDIFGTDEVTAPSVIE
jgi:hypothetical protein